MIARVEQVDTVRYGQIRSAHTNQPSNVATTYPTNSGVTTTTTAVVHTFPISPLPNPVLQKQRMRVRTDSQESDRSVRALVSDCGTDVDDWSDASTTSSHILKPKVTPISLQTSEPYSRRDIAPKSSPTPSNRSHRKSVSFDLGDSDNPANEFAPRSSSMERLLNDNYEVPLAESINKPHLRKGILRSPSPMLSSPLDRPPQTPTPNLPSGRRDIVYVDREIERDNPFRREFFNEDDEPTQNIYEEIGFNREPKECADNENDRLYRNVMMAPPKKVGNTSSIQSSADSYRYHSNEALLDANVKKIPIKWPFTKSTGDLSVRPKEGPPLPPKPKVKTAEIVYNQGLKTLRQEMEIGDLVELEHNPVTNTVSAVPKPPKVFDFNADTPLPPIPQSPSKVKIKSRPNESPPPPPVNLATLPSRNKMHRIEADPSIIGIVPNTKLCGLTSPRPVGLRPENSPDNILVSESTHRDILIHENQVRNNLMSEGNESPKINVPVRHAPPPPVPVKSPSTPSQVLPPPQILPVQYSHLPMPQHPGYFHAPPYSTNTSSPQTSFNYVPSQAASAAASLMLSPPPPPPLANYLVSSDPNATNPFAFPSHAYQPHFTSAPAPPLPLVPSGAHFQSHYSNLAASQPSLNWSYFQQQQHHHQQQQQHHQNNQLQYEYEQQQQQQQLHHQYNPMPHRSLIQHQHSHSLANLASPTNSSLASSVFSVNSSFSSSSTQQQQQQQQSFVPTGYRLDENVYDVPCRDEDLSSDDNCNPPRTGVRSSSLARSSSMIGKETVV